MKFLDKIKGAPTHPGVYLFKDGSGRIVYIGKAASLKNRLAFYANRADDKSRLLMNQARDIDTIITESDIEALTLEESLIKLHKPKYNIRLKDDKKYPYLKLTVKDKYPRIFFTRDTRPDDSLRFGPYTNARALRLTRDALCRIFKLVSCEKDLTKTYPRACLEYNLKRCSGPCIQAISEEDYRLSVRKAIQFLRGRSSELASELEKLMWEHARQERFEAASGIRDQLLAVQNISQRHQVVSDDGIDRDIIGLARSGSLVVACLFRIRENRLEAKETMRLAVLPGDTAADIVDALIRLIYTHVSYLPREIVVPEAGRESAIQEKWFADRGSSTKVVVPAADRIQRLADWARRNAEAELSTAVVRRTVPHSLLELQEFLKTPRPLRWIEAFDISNLGEKWAVGASVAFQDGRPYRSRYRRYRIKRVTGQNDFAMIREIVDRRVTDLKRGGRLPDLLLIDGGRLQQDAARQALRQVELDIPLFALAKRRGQLFYPDGRCISIPPFSRSVILLKRIQDEAHRFAIAYHRKVRRRQVTVSELDRIPGIGPKRKIILLKSFGSLDALKKVSEEDISKLPGIGPGVARVIYESLHT